MRPDPREPEAQVRQLTEGDLPAALDLVCSTWQLVPPASHEAMVRHDPWRERQGAFGAFVGPRLVSQARFHWRPVRLGQAIVHLGHVSCVVTHPDFRHRGLGQQVMRAGLAWMQQAGCHVSLLTTGVPGFYARLGWGQIETPYYRLPVAISPRMGSGRYRVCPAPTFPARAELGAVYAAGCGRHPISVARTPEYWEGWARWSRDNPWFGLTDNEWSVAYEGKRLVAYGGLGSSLHHPEAGAIVEACALPGAEEALLDVFDHLVARARREARESIDLNLPLDHPLVERLAPIAERRTHRVTMLRVVSLPALLEALRLELERRAQRLSRPVQVRLECAVGATTLLADKGSVAISDALVPARADFGGAGLAALMLGFAPSSQLVERGELEAAGSVLEALEVLFPWQRSHYWQIDGL